MACILIIEDNQEVRDNISDILILAGYTTLTAANGTEGVELAVAKQPQLILCDIMMPSLDGFGVLKILGARPDTQNIPFVFATAKSEQEDLRRGMNLGADDYVTKPFYKDELLRVIEVRLRKSSYGQAATEGQQSEQSGLLSRPGLEAGVQSLLKHCVRRSYKRGEAIYRAGEQVRDVFMIRSGYAKHQLTTEFGKTLIVYVFRPTDLFGYPEMIARSTYLHDTIALTDVEVDIIPIQAVREKCISNSNISNLLLEHLARGLLDADQRMLEQAYMSVRQRCAKALLRAHSTFGDDDWPMSREELAQWAGTAKETLIRNLTDFRESGYLTIASSSIRVVDAQRLADLPG